MAGSRRYRKPLVSFEFGTRIYAPTAAEPRYRVVSPGVDGVRVSQKFTTEDAARSRARDDAGDGPHVRGDAVARRLR